MMENVRRCDAKDTQSSSTMLEYLLDARELAEQLTEVIEKGGIAPCRDNSQRLH
jgi:hypothetical protein